MTERKEFMSRIRQHLKSGKKIPPPPQLRHDLIRRVSASADLVARFSVQATAAGMQVHRANSEQLVSTIGRILELQRSATGERLLRVSSCVERDWDYAPALDSDRVERIHWDERDDLDALFDADVAITDVDQAIAETGSLVYGSTPSRSRSGFLVAPVHVALLHIDQIVPDLLDIWDGIAATRSASDVVISGPSKTADIEGILVTGVHGPEHVHVILCSGPCPQPRIAKS